MRKFKLVKAPKESFEDIPYKDFTKKAYHILFKLCFSGILYEGEIEEKLVRTLIRAGLIGKLYTTDGIGYGISESGVEYLGEYEEWLGLKPIYLNDENFETYDGKYFCRKEYHFDKV